jgi:hypothetical protein
VQKTQGLRSQIGSGEDFERRVFFSTDAIGPQARSARERGHARCIRAAPTATGEGQPARRADNHKPVMFERWFLHGEFNHAKHGRRLRGMSSRPAEPEHRGHPSAVQEHLRRVPQSGRWRGGFVRHLPRLSHGAALNGGVKKPVLRNCLRAWLKTLRVAFDRSGGRPRLP